MANSKDPAGFSAEVTRLVESVVLKFNGTQRHERTDPVDISLWNELEGLGLTGIGVDEALGGSGGSFRDAMAAAFVLAKGACAVPYAEMIVGSSLLGQAGLQVAQGPVALAIDGPVSGVHEDGGGLILTGTVRAVTWASVSRSIVGTATVDDRTVVFTVPTESVRTGSGTNLAGEPCESTVLDGVRAEVYATLDCKLPLQLLALARSVQIAGAAERALELAVSQGRERVQFGRPIGKFQAIQHHLAIIAEEAELARIASETAITAHEAASDLELAVAMAKIVTSQAATTIAARVHQVHGAIGLTSEFELQRLTRRMWSWRDDAGTESDWAERAGTIIAGAGHEKFWPLLTAGDQVS